MVKGIKTLLSSIPGATALSPLADIMFSSFGLSNSYSYANGTVDATASIFGLCSCTGLTYANILAHAPNVARNTGKGPRIVFDSPFDDAKLISVSFTILPQGKIDTRNGKWAAVFIPVRSSLDVNGIPKEYKPMTLGELTKLPGSVTNAADRPLRLTYSPTAEDGYAFQFNPISSIFGYLIIGFTQELRVSWADFDANEFSPDIIMDGSLRIRQPVLGGTVHSYEDKTWKADTGIRLLFGSSLVNSTGSVGVTLASDYTCKKEGNLCKLSGKVYKFVPPLSTLESSFVTLGC